MLLLLISVNTPANESKRNVCENSDGTLNFSNLNKKNYYVMLFRDLMIPSKIIPPNSQVLRISQ